MSVIFRNVVVYIAISSGLFMFSQSCVKVPTSLYNVGCQAVDRMAGAGDIDLVWNYRIDWATITKLLNCSSIFFLDESIEGYVHLLTEVQTARNSTTNYFNCRIQTGQREAVLTVCYSPQKHTNLNQAFLNNSAVKIIGVKHTPSKRFHTQDICCPF